MQDSPGVKTSPLAFASCIDKIYGDLKVLTYIDYLLVHTTNHETHLKEVEEVLIRTRQYWLLLNPAQSKFGCTETEYSQNSR